MTWGQLIFLVSSLTAGFGVIQYNAPCCNHEEPINGDIPSDSEQQASGDSANETPAIKAEAIEPEATEILVPTTIRDEVLEPVPLWNPITIWVYDSKTGEASVQSFSGDRLPRASGKHRLVAQWGDYEQ
jgi:hypothetical protein